jgi:hypothetical protein
LAVRQGIDEYLANAANIDIERLKNEERNQNPGRKFTVHDDGKCEFDPETEAQMRNDPIFKEYLASLSTIPGYCL